MEQHDKICLLGKIIIRGDICVITGLRIAGPTTGLKIGGIDHPVICDAFGKPYIPGSSLKGKLRTLAERKEGVKLNKMQEKEVIRNGKKERVKEPYAHECESNIEYQNCPVCKIWGVLGGSDIAGIPVLTRIMVRDVPLDETSITEEMKRNLELEWTEVKMETAIDRYKGTARGGSLRTIDRVPAGAVFSPMEIIYNVYEEADKALLVKVFEAMELLEDDYLGGMGSRGYGKIKFKNIKIYWNKKEDYETGKLNQRIINGEYNTPSLIVENFNEIVKNIK